MRADVRAAVSWDNKMITARRAVISASDAVDQAIADSPDNIEHYRDQVSQLEVMDTMMDFMVQKERDMAIEILPGFMQTYAKILVDMMHMDAKAFLEMQYNVNLGVLRGKLESADILIKSLRQFAYQRNDQLKWAWRLSQQCVCFAKMDSIAFPDSAFDYLDPHGRWQEFFRGNEPDGITNIKSLAAFRSYVVHGCLNTHANIVTELATRIKNKADYWHWINAMSAKSVWDSNIHNMHQQFMPLQALLDIEVNYLLESTKTFKEKYWMQTTRSNHACSLVTGPGTWLDFKILDFKINTLIHIR